MSHVNDHISSITRENIEEILCAEARRRALNPWRYRAIAMITRACGTVGFLVANVLFFALWVVTNELVVEFDPYPYTFLLFGVSLDAIFLSIFILISQNMDAAESERRHHLDLQVNLLAEREITALMRLVVEMAEKAGLSEDKTEEVRAFAHRTDPSDVLQEIVEAEHKHHLESAGQRA